MRIENETVWLTRQQMADLFQRDRTVIGRHINNIFKERELEESLVCAKFAHTIGKHINNALKEELQGVPVVANFATVQIGGNRTLK